MALFKCKACGGNVVPNEDGFTGKCEYCGSIQTLPKDKDERISQILNRANDYRLNSEFDRAIFEYEKVLEINETEPEAHWGVFLSKYGVEYVKDPTTYIYKPTLHRISSVSVFDDVDYKATLKYSDMVSSTQYKKDAENIEAVMKELLLISANQDAYDIFLSYKEVDDVTRQRTDDSYLAHDLYNELTAQGYKVFFAPKSLGVGLYEPRIYSAIISSKVMIVLGTKSKYYDAVWVKNEWSRFAELIENGEDKALIPVFKNMKAEELPNRLAKYQALDMSNISFLPTLFNMLSEFVSRRKSNVKFNSDTTAEGAYVERGFLALEDRNFSQAESFFENALNLNPHSSQAYFGKLMVEMRISKQSQILTSSQYLKNYNNFEKAVRFADQQLKTTLLQYEEKVTEAVNFSLYNKLKEQIVDTNTSAAWRNLAENFHKLSSFKDSEEITLKCRKKADLIEEKIAMEESLAADEERKIKLIANNGINCNWYILRGVATFIAATSWFGVIVALILAFLTFAVYIFGFKESDYNIAEWEQYIFSSGSSGDYIVFILGSIIPLILLGSIMEFVFAVIKRLFFNNNTKISEISRKISEDNKKLNDIENQINSISF